MREPKYYVKGTKGKIEVSKGTFLSMEKRNNHKKTKKEFLNFNTNSYLVKQKHISKKVKFCLISKKSTQIKKKNCQNFTVNESSEPISLQEKDCPNTIESLKNNEEREIVPEISEFCFQIENEFPEIKTNNQNGYLIERETSFSDEKIGQNIENYWRPSNFFSNEDETDHEERFDEDDVEESTWSMINENVQSMSLNLSLSVYDFLYGKREE